MRDKLRTWIEINTKALTHNYRFFRSWMKPQIKLLAVTKSNAYGHSLVDYAKLMSKLGADYLGVDSIVEALTLRQAKITKPILVLGYSLSAFYSQAAKQKIILSLSSFDQLNDLEKFARTTRTPLAIHLKIDTGM
ncbi:MAG: alanine racemase, partial [Patescibacteria group bacterium]